MTVNQAFADFMQNTVNLDSEVVKAARKSRDNLLDNISEFSEKTVSLNFILVLMSSSVLLLVRQNVESWMI